jgi:hypothetical protein
VFRFGPLHSNQQTIFQVYRNWKCKKEILIFDLTIKVDTYPLSFSTSEYDESFCTVVKSYDLRDPSVEYTPPKKPFTKWTILKYVIFLLLPVLLPLWIIIAFSYVASQGLGSRIRVAGILRNAASKINDQSNNTKKIMPVEDSKVSPTVSLGSITDSTKAQQDGAVDVVDKFVEEAVLVPALDGMNFPGEANILKKDGSESSEDVIIDSKCDIHLANNNLEHA